MMHNSNLIKLKDPDREEIARLTAEYEAKNGPVKTSPPVSCRADVPSDQWAQMRRNAEVNAARRRIKLNEG